MSLTLIQQQVLTSLVEACGTDTRRRDSGVHPSVVRDRLLTRRPRAVSEAYVRAVLRDLCQQGSPTLVEERHAGRNRKHYVALNAAYEWVQDR